MSLAIVRLAPADLERELGALAEVLWDCVDGGASVSFVKPFGRAEAEAYWRGVLASAADAAHVVLAARLDGTIVGTVQLVAAWPPNQAHRADVCKLLVRRDARRRGVARALMIAIEREALALGRTLLTLDTQEGGAAEPLYHALGYTPLGVIPRYALSSAGALEGATFFYKHLVA